MSELDLLAADVLRTAGTRTGQIYSLSLMDESQMEKVNVDSIDRNYELLVPWVQMFGTHTPSRTNIKAVMKLADKISGFKLSGMLKSSGYMREAWTDDEAGKLHMLLSYTVTCYRRSKHTSKSAK